eukprot:g14.t1
MQVRAAVDELVIRLEKQQTKLTLPLAAIDCSKNRLCKNFGVSGFPPPVFKHFETSKGKGKRLDVNLYTVEKELYFLENYMTVRSLIKNSEDEDEKEAQEEKEILGAAFRAPDWLPGEVVQLTEESWAEFAAAGHEETVVALFNRGCGNWEGYEPTYEEEARKAPSALPRNIPFVKVDCTSEKVMCHAFDMKKSPTILYIPNKEAVMKGLEAENMFRFSGRLIPWLKIRMTGKEKQEGKEEL